MAPHIILYLDPASPYAFLSLHLLLTHRPFTATPLTLVPVFLGGIMAATGNKAPMTVPAKGVYLEIDRKRLCNRFSIPFRSSFPEKFPINTLSVSRLLVAVGLALGEEAQKKAIWAVCKGLWVDAVDVEDKAAVAEVVGKVVGKEAWGKVEAVMAERMEEVKEKLKKNTEEAVDRGAFGVPWMVVKGVDGKEEVVWGVDHLDIVAEAVGGVWPPPKNERGAVKAVL